MTEILKTNGKTENIADLTEYTFVLIKDYLDNGCTYWNGTEDTPMSDEPTEQAAYTIAVYVLEKLNKVKDLISPFPERYILELINKKAEVYYTPCGIELTSNCVNYQHELESDNASN